MIPACFQDERYRVNRVLIQPVLRVLPSVLEELVKIAAVGIFLHFLQVRFLLPKIDVRIGFSFHHYCVRSGLSRSDIFTRIVERPLSEEIVIRGFLLRGLSLFPVSGDSRIRQICRISFSSATWTLLHVGNIGTGQHSRLYLAGRIFISGIAYGYLSERYSTLSVSYLAHGLHNFLCIAVVLYPDNGSLGLALKAYPFVLLLLAASKETARSDARFLGVDRL